MPCVTCVHRKVVGCGMSSTGYVVHVVVYGEWVVLCVAETMLQLTATSRHGQLALYMYVEGMECKSSAESVWHVGVDCGLLQLLGMADKDCLVSGRLWCEQH